MNRIRVRIEVLDDEGCVTQAASRELPIERVRGVSDLVEIATNQAKRIWEHTRERRETP